MKLLLQRVTEARVAIDDEVIASIGPGLLLFAGICRDDNRASIARLAQRLLAYRVFSDQQGRMNRSVADIGGQLLVVSQFTLAADTRRGRRPSFSSSAPPEQAEPLYDHFIACLRETGLCVESGRFAADMQVSLVNDGPVTFLLE